MKKGYKLGSKPEAVRRLLSEAQKGKPCPSRGRKWSDDRKKHWSSPLAGLSFSWTPERLAKRAATNLKRYGRADGPRRDTKPELAVKRWLESRQISFLYQHPMYGTIVDFYVPDLSLVIEVYGCYWHGHDCSRNPHRHNLSARQLHQIQKDKKNIEKLESTGHDVTVFWECNFLLNFAIELTGV